MHPFCDLVPFLAAGTQQGTRFCFLHEMKMPGSNFGGLAGVIVPGNPAIRGLDSHLGGCSGHWEYFLACRPPGRLNGGSPGARQGFLKGLAGA